ncbi:MAG: MBOAT family protein [Candidatus Lambdaproteobacteria bacterium]|nr:MBOAT family protein [Candidatus Lambdaproteobacteria bacterium]
MLFQSTEFIVYFLPITLAGFFLLGRVSGRLAIAWMTGCSLVFYGWGEQRYLLLILSSIAVNFGIGYALSQPGGSPPRRKAWLWAGIVFDLGAVGLFKYTNFLLGTANTVFGAGLPLAEIGLPLGISFYTFQQMAYLVDCYRHQVREHDLVRYSLFVAFFPQLIAGPIVHHQELIPRFGDRRILRPSPEWLAEGAAIFLLGVFKKVALGDLMGGYADRVFAAADGGTPVMLVEAWHGVLAFALQIYFDFSGYSDMAIGMAWMIGIRLPLNFDSPYRAASIVEFWQRWHMTLSRWLRDYLYFPLGGNRLGPRRRYINLMAVMVLGGLWHGASWMFVLWGALHGLLLCVNHWWRALRPRLRAIPAWSAPAEALLYRLLTLLAVLLAWIPFRARTLGGALGLLKGMAGLNGVFLLPQIAALLPFRPAFVRTEGAALMLGDGPAQAFAEAILLLLLGLALVLFGPSMHRMSHRARLGCVALVFAFDVHYVFFGGGANPFIYFRF